jgi:hypothetical protein
MKNRVGARFSRGDVVGTTFAISLSKASFITQRRTAMKLKVETLMLQSLFGACVLICAMTVGSMLLA